METIPGCKLPRHHENPLDWLIFRAVEPLLAPMRAAGITPNAVTLASAAAAAISLCACFWGRPNLAVGAWVANYLLDCVDGFMARRFNMESAWGDAADHLTDALSFLGLMAFIGLRAGQIPISANWPLLIECILLAASFYHMQCQEKDTVHLSIRGIDGCRCFDKDHLRVTRWFGTGTLLMWHVALIYYYTRPR